MMSLLKWQAKILNKLFRTNAFQQIVLDHTDLQQVDYERIYKIFKNEQLILAKTQQEKFNNQKLIIQQVVQSANIVCQPTIQSTLIRDQIVKLNSLVQSLSSSTKEFQYMNAVQCKIQTSQILNHNETHSQQQFGSNLSKSSRKYTLEHIIIYSSLSKCRIWPKMLKSSSNLVPSLISFYNEFTKDFSYDLSYKFDPVILTHKYEKVMNRIEQKKKSFPQLFKAIEQNNWSQITELIQSINQDQKQKNFINECKKDSYYISHHAVMYSSLQTIQKLYKQYNLNFQNEDHEKQTAIFYAVKRNSFEIVKFLVEQVKVNINHKEYQNRTPIYLGAFEGNLKIVDYLYKMGANPEMESKLSRTPLSKACYLGNVSVAQYLIKIGVNLTTVDSKGRTALHNAAWGIEGGREGKKRGSIKLQDSPECAELLLKAGHPVDLEDFDGFTPLMSAAASLAIKSMRVLINYGANLKHKTKKNETLVFVAAKYGHLPSLKILIQQFNCDYEEPSCYGVTPLDASFTIDQSNVCEYLLDLYMKKDKLFSFESLVKCLCYYKKEKNLSYLKKWAKDVEAKKEYVFASLKHEIDTKEDFVNQLFENEKDLLVSFLDFFEFQIDKLDTQIAQFIIDRCIGAYKKGHLPNFPEFLCENQQILKEKQITIKDLQIQVHTKQEDIIKILSIETNLTQSPKSVHRCMLFLVKRRMTKVLLWILTLHSNPSFQQTKNSGLYRYSKQQIQDIVKHETQEHASIENYCYVHGIHDAVKILQLQQKQLKIFIPKYEYWSEINENPNPTGLLLPVKMQYFDFKFLIDSHLGQEQSDFYKESMTYYNKRIKMVESVEDLEKMAKHFSKCKLIGVDIQHFNNSNEEFVCLIQMSGMGETFLIDTLKLHKEPIKEFLANIMHDQHKIKIFHSYDQDLKWIGEDFHIESFKSIVDTSKMYSILNPKTKSPSLKFLAESILGEKISKDFQRSDWRIRPLFREMIVYAGTDALLLPFLYLKQLMDSNIQVQSENQKDNQFFDMVKKQFGGKRYIKCKGRKNYLKLLQ